MQIGSARMTTFGGKFPLEFAVAVLFLSERSNFGKVG